jgi:hypothetical protein
MSERSSRKRQQLRPERLGLGLAGVQAKDLAPSGLVNSVGDDDALALHPAPSRTCSIFPSTNRYG